MGLIQRRAPVKWNDLDFTEFQTPNNPFSEFATWLTPLNITPDNALIFFSIDYEEALTEYSEIMIGTIMHAVAAANAKKYDKLIAAYTAQYDPLDEYSDTDGYTDTRTPNLTQNSTGGATVGTTIKNNQTRTDTYTGQADETNSTSTTSNITTNTGTETIVHTGSSSGRKKSPAQLLDEELALAERMNIFKIIERDIAAKLFIAVWPTFLRSDINVRKSDSN